MEKIDKHPIPSKSAAHLKEKLFLLNQAKEGNLKVLPGNQWGLHYPEDEDTREQKLQGLLDGGLKPDEVASTLKPDAIIYDVNDLELKNGLEKVMNRIRDISSSVAHFDYERLADFVSRMQGKEIDLATIETLYNGLALSRIRKKVFDSLGVTGKKQMRETLKDQAQNTLDNFSSFPYLEKVLHSLELNWLHEDLGLISSEDRDRAIASLSKEEFQLFKNLQEAYQKYVQTGNESFYEELVKTIQDCIPELKPRDAEKKEVEIQEEMQELERFEQEVGPPGSPQDPGIPPDDEDEYHTPPPREEGVESKEKIEPIVLFEITPAGTSNLPMTDYFAQGRKSYFDRDRKTWSKKKQLVPYHNSIKGEERQKISATISGGIKAIPIPVSYALDSDSLTYSGDSVEFFRDQNGCFYVKTQGITTFSIDFLKEHPPFQNSPIKEDLESLYQGMLSNQTEACMRSLSGTPLEKAAQAQEYILTHHDYPAGGNLKKAQALQYKLRMESDAANYLQNIDKSQFLECYSANTLFIAMMRKAGIPARLVVGHKIDSAKDGKSFITDQTGHAWSEIWDGRNWTRVDATPKPRPQDQKDQGQEKSKDGTPGQKADDQSLQGKSTSNELGQKVKEKIQNTASSLQEKPFTEMEQASDSELKESEKDIEESKEMIKKSEQKKQELSQKLEKAESFKELSELEKEINKEEDLIDEDMKDLTKKIDAKEEEMKNEIKNEMKKMVEEGFMDEEKKQALEEKLEESALSKLDDLKKQIEAENRLYLEYEEIKAEIEPLVDYWYRHFVEKLPRTSQVEIDEDSLTRQGAFNRRSLNRPRNLIFGLIKNPRIFRPEIKPKFLAAFLIDMSGSMQGAKITNARKLLIFYSELFSRIEKEFGYLRFALYGFADGVTALKNYNQEYDSHERYDFNGVQLTIKARLMKALKASGGTNMLEAIKQAAADLNQESFDYADYVSAFYFTGDGGDTCGNSANIKKFLELNDKEKGFGEHMRSAIFLGNESERKVLAEIFGEKHTQVASDFETLLELSMEQFDQDITEYVDSLTH